MPKKRFNDYLQDALDAISALRLSAACADAGSETDIRIKAAYVLLDELARREDC